MSSDGDRARARLLADSPSSGWQAALEATSEAVVLLDVNHRITWFNRAAAEMCRLEDADLGERWADLLPTDAGHEVEHIARIAAGSPVHRFDSSRIDGFGMRVAVEVTLSPIEVDGVLEGVVVVSRDISEQLLMQGAVAEMAQRAEETQSLAKVGLWVWDRDADNVQWTSELYRIHGVDPGDFTGTLDGHLSAIREAEREPVRQALLDATTTGDECDLTYRIRTLNGERWIRSSARRAVADGQVTGLVGTCQDITQQHRYSEAIEVANRELERFAGAVAHDLKTPLTIVVGMADLLRTMVADNEMAVTLAQKIVDSGTQASTMITDLIASARQAAMRRAMAPADLGGVLARVRANLQEQLVEADARLVVGPLPTVEGVEALLRQVFFNLIGNAIKYRSPDRQLVIDVQADISGDDVTVRVVDNGRGISPDHRESVFAEGVRVAPDASIEGTGMGLSTCRQIMEQHGGTINVIDGIDGGSTMVLTFPRNADSSDDGDESAG